MFLEYRRINLSWIRFLFRGCHRAAFGGFDPVIIAGYKEKDIQRLLKNEGIIRNSLKIEAAITNAKKFLDVQKEMGSFDAYI